MSRLKRIAASFDTWQRRHAAGGLPVAVGKKFGDDQASHLAALIAYYAFFSLFPLLLAFVSILGFVLQDNASLRDDAINTALGRIPVIGRQLRDEVHPLAGNGVALAIGLIGALWAGLAVTLAMQRAFGEVWDVARVDRPSGVMSRLRGLAVLVILGVTLVAASALAGLAVGGNIDPFAGRFGAVVLSFLVDVVIFLAVFGLLTPRPHELRDLLPGVALTAVGWLVLESAGTWYINRTVSGASDTYGTFALVIGLLSWFWLGAQLLLLAAEVNVVLSWRLWPRSLTGDLEPADRLALGRLAAAERVDRREQISVTFGEPPDDD
jgi:membrane protein